MKQSAFAAVTLSSSQKARVVGTEIRVGSSRTFGRVSSAQDLSASRTASGLLSLCWRWGTDGPVLGRPPRRAGSEKWLMAFLSSSYIV